MSISSMQRLKCPFIVILLPAFFLLAVAPPVVAQDQKKGEGRVENAKWIVEGDFVVITYDLVADPELTYEVSIVLKRVADANFKIAPSSVTGAIGKGKFAGVKREIRWEFKKDVAAGLPGDDYQFDFSIEVVKGTSAIWYILGAGLVGAGGVIVSQLSKNKEGSSVTPITTSGLPDAPRVRPANQ
jgi:hypothetical protein